MSVQTFDPKVLARYTQPSKSGLPSGFSPAEGRVVVIRGSDNRNLLSFTEGLNAANGKNIINGKPLVMAGFEAMADIPNNASCRLGILVIRPAAESIMMDDKYLRINFYGQTILLSGLPKDLINLLGEFKDHSAIITHGVHRGEHNLPYFEAFPDRLDNRVITYLQFNKADSLADQGHFTLVRTRENIPSASSQISFFPPQNPNSKNDMNRTLDAVVDAKPYHIDTLYAREIGPYVGFLTARKTGSTYSLDANANPSDLALTLVHDPHANPFVSQQIYV